MKLQRSIIAILLSGMTLLMAQPASGYDEETLGLLKKSVSEWNAMRLAQPGKSIDLYKAKLEDDNLTEQTSVKLFLSARNSTVQRSTWQT